MEQKERSKYPWPNWVGGTWYHALEDFWESEGVDRIMDWMQYHYIRSDYRVFPTKDNVFKAFLETPYNRVKMIWLGQDPYPNMWKDIPYATGLCFDCGLVTNLGGPVSPSMEKIIDEYNRCYTSNFSVDVLHGVLRRWARGGILMLNSSLTVREGNPKSHSEVWAPFMRGLLRRIGNGGADLFSGGELKEVPYLVAFGKHAQGIAEEVYPVNKLIKVVHPAYACYNNTDWKPFGDKGFFEEINRISGLKMDW